MRNLLQMAWESTLDGGHVWTSATYVPGLEGVCCSSGAGLVVTVSADGGAVEPVGDFPSGILALSWSPDYEIVVILAGDGSLVTMTTSWKVMFPPPDSFVRVSQHFQSVLKPF